MSTIYFTVNYRSGKKNKVEDFIQAYVSKAGIQIEELKIEIYWKDKNYMQATFSMKIESSRKEDKTFQILELANILAPSQRHQWTFNGPHENGELTFSCVLNNDSKDQPVAWASIELED